jgi:hypothetical protein
MSKRAKTQVHFADDKARQSYEETPMSARQYVDSASDEHVLNNAMRHEYRVLSDLEKAQMLAIKDCGLQFHEQVNKLGASREIALAKTKIEEAVMWAIKHLTK